MFTSQQDQNASSKLRPRANTSSFGVLSWRRNRFDASAPVPASSPAAPIQTTPIDVLIQALTPPVAPSLSHARSLITALSTQTPAPSSSMLSPIISNLCCATQPPAIQAAGHEILGAYCTCGVPIPTSDRMIYFDIVQGASMSWSQDVWEPRLKALNALLVSVDDVIGLEHPLLSMLSFWFKSAVEDFHRSEAHERQDKERAVTVLSEALTDWFDKLDLAGRISEEVILSIFMSYENIVNYVLEHPLPQTLCPSPSRPTTPITASTAFQRGDLSSEPASGSRHRRHPSSSTNTSILPSGSQPPSLLRPSTGDSITFIMTVYLVFIQKHISRLPLVCLSRLVPLLFKVLSMIMSSLPALPSQSLGLSKLQTVESLVNNTITSLLSGPFSSTCLVILRQRLSPCHSADVGHSDIDNQLKISLGALRTLRLQIRRVLKDRMAVRLVQRDVSSTSSPAGASGSMFTLDKDILNRAQRARKWEGFAMWDARKVSSFLVRSIRAWVECPTPTGVSKDQIFEEMAFLMEDVLVELDHRNEDHEISAAGDFYDNESASAVGRTLYELMSYVKMQRNPDNSPLVFGLRETDSSHTPFLSSICRLFSCGRNVSYLDPPLPLILLEIAEHLPDEDTEKIPRAMERQGLLKPSTENWLDNWTQLLGNHVLFTNARQLTRRAVVATLASVYYLIREMAVYRLQLVDVVFDFWMRIVEEGSEGSEGTILWDLLGDEVTLRAVEDDNLSPFSATPENHPRTSSKSSTLTIDKIILTMVSVSGYCNCDGDINGSENPTVAFSPTPVSSGTSGTSGSISPAATRQHVDGHVVGRERESGNVQQQIMSLLSFGSSRQNQVQTQNVVISDDPSPMPQAESSPAPISSGGMTQSSCRGLAAVTAFINLFTQLAFKDDEMTEQQARLATYVFGHLLKLLRTAYCSRSRVSILQLLMCLRADRDHTVFLKPFPEEYEKQVNTLAHMIGRDSPLRSASGNATSEESQNEDTPMERVRVERDGRRASRGHAVRGPDASSRSHSRATARGVMYPVPPMPVRLREPLWWKPESVTFSLENTNKGSQLLITYSPGGTHSNVKLPVSSYMDALIEILKMERDWDVLSYVLVHLPAQLANKHFWCSPEARESISNLLIELCKAMLDNTLGKYVSQEEYPGSLRTRDAQSLAYHTLVVLVSYQGIFNVQKRQILLEVFQAGLGGKGDAVIVCTHALILCLFEMETTVIKSLPHILQKLTQIVSNPTMAVHILTFLYVLSALPHMYQNFTENDFKMVFAVALQYLQHHNRAETLREVQFSLSQYVRILSYSVLYLWFLKVRLVDRPQYIKYIVRQLLLANEGRDQIDEPTEVCFDMLARYTYATADPKPAPSMLHEILSTEDGSTKVGVVEKSWVVGYSIVTVRLLGKAGWIEITTRRSSGTTRFLCKAENVPLVGLCDNDPDMLSIPASLMMDKDPRTSGAIRSPERLSTPPDIPSPYSNRNDLLKALVFHEDNAGPPKPDPITGYVWSNSAPSQRRKVVDLDPAYFPIQMSAYPDISNQVKRGRIVHDTKALGIAIRNLDRMPVIDTQKVGILYVAQGQTDEIEILRNVRGSPAYTKFLEGLGRLIKLRGQQDVYTGGLDPDEDGEYAYAWWDDTGQILYHTATMMPNHLHDAQCNMKKRHIGNDLVRIVWNDSGLPYRFDTLKTEFQFVNIVIEPHSQGTIAAYSHSRFNKHEGEYFKLSVQTAEGMAEFTPIGDFKIVSARSLSVLVRQLSLLTDWYASIFKDTVCDTERNEIVTNWRARLAAIKRFASSVPNPFDQPAQEEQGIMKEELLRDFAIGY